MLALKGHELGFEMHVMSASPNDPAAQVVNHHFLGDPNRLESLKEFFATVDVATFESEFLNPDLLNSGLSGTAVKIFPEPATMGVLQDRLSQKELLDAHKIPTLDFAAVDSLAEAEEFMRYHPGGVALKQRRFGYDGYGTFIVRKAPELPSLFTKWENGKANLLAEPLCRFKRELAVSLVRSPNGDIREFPLVESRQQESRCLWVKGPVKHRDQIQLTQKLRKMLNAVDYVGVIAFELFETEKGLLVNEAAPRVHNSAHYSLDAMDIDQFTAHILAVAGAEIPKFGLRTKAFAMMNLLGKSSQPPAWRLSPDVHLHWYGKSENRPGRKMGHLNALGKSAEEALKRVQTAERKFKL
jgi:5-(carboxyamino)imidazole ribonucleotide synthase